MYLFQSWVVSDVAVHTVYTGYIFVSTRNAAQYSGKIAIVSSIISAILVLVYILSITEYS